VLRITYIVVCVCGGGGLNVIAEPLLASGSRSSHLFQLRTDIITKSRRFSTLPVSSKVKQQVKANKSNIARSKVEVFPTSYGDTGTETYIW
jgi:hypothetical protein